MKLWTDPKCLENKQNQENLKSLSIHQRKQIFSERYPIHSITPSDPSTINVLFYLPGESKKIGLWALYEN
jgi:hypothetical protein